MSIIRTLGRAAILAGVAAVAAVLAPSARADNDINAWGKPDFEKGDVHRAAIWRDDDGWHIRWTTAGKPHEFSGWISTPGGEFTKIVMVGKEKNDWARVSPKDRKLVFETRTEGGVDGFDFRSDSKELTFQLLMDGRELPEQILIGANDRHPPKLPFTLDKWESHPRGR